jgi:transglutaminase/protease-like cytokinesis protein 3
MRRTLAPKSHAMHVGSAAIGSSTVPTSSVGHVASAGMQEETAPVQAQQATVRPHQNCASNAGSRVTFPVSARVREEMEGNCRCPLRTMKLQEAEEGVKAVVAEVEVITVRRNQSRSQNQTITAKVRQTHKTILVGYFC